MDEVTRQALLELCGYLDPVIGALDGLPQDTVIARVYPAGLPPIVGSGCNVMRGGCRPPIEVSATPTIAHVAQLARNIRERLADLAAPPPIG